MHRTVRTVPENVGRTTCLVPSPTERPGPALSSRPSRDQRRDTGPGREEGSPERPEERLRTREGGGQPRGERESGRRAGEGQEREQEEGR